MASNRGRRIEVELPCDDLELERGAERRCDAPAHRPTTTNFGAFGVYVVAYLRNHPMLHQEMTFLMRHLAPTEHGLSDRNLVVHPDPGLEQL